MAGLCPVTEGEGLFKSFARHLPSATIVSNSFFVTGCTERREFLNSTMSFSAL